MSARDVLAGAGVAAVAVALLLVVRPSYAAGLGLPRLAVVIVGLLALVEGVRSIGARRRATIGGAEPADVEERATTPVPGDEFDGRLAEAGPAAWLDDGERIRGRLRAAAIAAVASRDDLSREEARERVEAGTWTDDPAAAAFLGGPEVPEPPWRVRVRLGLGPLRSYAVRTIDAIADARERP